MKTIEIRNGYFYSAGKKYGWAKEGYEGMVHFHPHGVGIDISVLTKEIDAG